MLTEGFYDLSGDAFTDEGEDDTDEQTYGKSDDDDEHGGRIDVDVEVFKRIQFSLQRNKPPFYLLSQKFILLALVYCFFLSNQESAKQISFP